MQVFINECSLDEQFNPHNLEEAIKTFLQSINSLNQFNNKTVFKSILFFNYKVIKGTHIETSLKANFSLNTVFIQNLKNAINWEESQTHDISAQYIYNEENFVSTSVAEITERKIKSPLLKAVLINFIDSKFGNNTQISIIKNGNFTTNVDCAFDVTSIHEWLIENGYIDPLAIYDESIGLPPLDKQTVLINEAFEPTQWRNGCYGRKVYRLRGTNQLWAVDSSLKHSTNKAHIEVFDEITKMHLGTSIYNAINLNTKYKKSNRSINLY